VPSEKNTKAIAGAVAGVVAIGAAAVWFDSSRTSAPADTAVAPQSAALVTDEAAAAKAEDEGSAAPDVSTEPALAATMPPSIDTFFRNPNETTVIAGRADPDQTLDIILSGEKVQRLKAGKDGAYGAVIIIGDSDQPRRLRVVADPDGVAVASAQSVIIPPSKGPSSAATLVQPDAAPAIAALGESDAAPEISVAPAGRVAVSAEVIGGAAPEISDNVISFGGDSGAAPDVSAPPTLIAEAGGVRIVQPVARQNPVPELTANIALDTITYDPEGEVLLAGRAGAGGFVRVYLDNQPITTSRISVDGNWQIDLPDVDTGIYTLRVDEVDEDGNVQSRIETPFKREEPADVAAILAEETSQDGFDIAVKTVQAGSTLWAIAEEELGEGILYVSVFEANKDLIRDPDLIYPGQVFRIPQATE